MVAAVGAVASAALAAASANIGANAGIQAGLNVNGDSSTAQPGFVATLNQALQSVSSAQSQAASAEAGFAAGVPGDTMAKALVASDRAEVAWNATVGVRNELVSAYQSVMNMQF